MKSIFSSSRNKSPHTNEESGKEEASFFGKEVKKPFFNGSSKGTVQTKLKVGEAGDKYEKEADNVANAVVNKTAKPDIQNKEISSIQRESLATPLKDEKLGTAEQRMEEDKLIQEKPETEKMPGLEEEEGMINKMDGEKEEEEASGMINKMDGEKEEEETAPIQTKSTTARTPQTASTGVTRKLKHKSGRGRSMSKKTKTEMETSFGVDFSGVNIHTDQDAVKMNKELGANAFTHGKDVYFNAGKYNPDSTEGKRLLAHELTHVVQQNKTILPKIQRDPQTSPILGPLRNLIPDTTTLIGSALGRPLNRREIGVLMPVYGPHLNYFSVRICQNSICSPDGVARTIGNLIASPGAISDSTLIHEAAHVWQHQNGVPYGYIPSALSAQLASWLLTGTRSGAYNYHPMIRFRIPWRFWNAEQQAKFIEDRKSLPPFLNWASGGWLPVR